MSHFNILQKIENLLKSLDKHVDQDKQFEDKQFEDKQFEDKQFEDKQFEDKQFEDKQFEDKQFQDKQFQDKQFQDKQFQDKNKIKPEVDTKQDEEKNSEENVKRQRLWKICSCLKPRSIIRALKAPRGVQKTIINKNKLWKKRELRVYFSNDLIESKDLIEIQDKIFKIAKEWEQYANITFIRSYIEKESEIRIDISIDGDSWSCVGTEAEGNSITMHFGWFYSAEEPDDDEYHATVLHEFGHALGFEHELQHPFQAIPWDKEKVYTRYKQSQGWSESEIDEQVLNRLPQDGNYLLDAKIDVNSIMCYEIDTELLSENTDLDFSNKRNCKLTSEDKHNAYAAYLFDFPAIGTKVNIKNKPQVLQSFEMAGRNDYINEVRDIHNNSQGEVIAHHTTMGILVRFANNDELWYEPTAMTIVNTPNGKSAINPIHRWFVGDRVKWAQATDEVDNVGTIRYHKSNELNQVTILISNKFIEVNPLELEKRIFYYNWPNNKGINPSLSLQPFPLNKEIKLKQDKIEVMRGFDMGGRDDYESKMERYLGKLGKIIMHHKTNGLRVQFDDEEKYWFEPPCLDPTPTDTYYSTGHNRMLVDAKVKIVKQNVKYSGCVAHVCLNIHDNDNIRLSIGDDFVEYPADYLEMVASFFE